MTRNVLRTAERLASVLSIAIEQADRQSRALWKLIVASKHWSAEELRQAKADGKVNAISLVPEARQ